MNRRFVVGAAAWFGLLVLILPRARAAENGPVTTLINDGQGAVRFEVAFDAPVWRDGTADGGYRYPSWPALTGAGDPGSPAIPMKVVRVAVPPGAVSLSYTTRERGRAEGVRFPPAPSYIPIDPRTRLRDPRVVHTQAVEGPGYAAERPLPQAEILADGVERGLRILNVGVRPVSWNPVTGTAVWSSSVTVTVSLPAGAAAVPARPTADRVGREGFHRDLVNPDAAARWQGTATADVPPLPTTNGVPATWFDDADGWAKIQIEANGVYKLDRSVLQNMGVPVSTVDPRTFRLFAGPLIPHLAWTDLGWDGVHATWQHVYDRPEFSEGFDAGFDEIPMLVRGNMDDGTLDGTDAFLFYALGPDNYRERYGLAPDSTAEYIMNPYTSRTVYWLAWGGDFPDPPQRIVVEDAAPAAGAPVVTTGRARTHFEKVDNVNSIYDPSMRDAGYRWQQWFWASISTSNPAGQGFQLDLPHAVPGSTFNAWVRLWGAQAPLENGYGEEMKHHVHVSVNDSDLGTVSWGGTYPTSFTHQDVVGDSIPVESPETLKLLVPQVGTNPKRYDEVYLTWVDVTYTRVFDAEGKPAEFSIDAGASGRTVRVARPPSGDPVVLDVTDPRHPIQLTGVQVTGSGSEATAEFAVADASSRIVTLASDGDLLSPASGSYRDEPPTGESGSVAWLRDASAPVDYVLVVGDGFEDAANVLAQWRRDHLQGITESRPARVRVVQVSDIMDEFTWGMWDPIAIRYFLEYVYRYYGPGEDRPSYCVFLGSHTRDPRDFHESGVPDVVPSWEDNRSTITDIRYGNVQYASDDPLARFNGYESGIYDPYTDLVIGRIPARTATQLRNVLQEKVVRAEAEPVYGPWRTRVILVADDNCQGKNPDPVGDWLHMQQTEDVDHLIPPIFDRTKVFLYEYGEACIYDSKPAAKQDLLDAWDRGAWLVNYIGHGGNVVMADEHVFDVADASVLTNDGRFPVLGAFSCSVGKFNHPKQQGIGEALILEPRTGTIVSAAATHLTNPLSNAELNKEFMRQLFPGGQPTPAQPIGAALMAAKHRSTRENDKYVCLGDPASLLSAPREELNVTGPDTLKAGATPEFAVSREDGDGGSSTVDVLSEGPRLQRNRTADGSVFRNWSTGYFLPGARLFSGRSAMTADSASVVFTVPRSIREGDDARVRIYGWGDGWDAVGGIGSIPTDARASGAVDDTTGPAVSYASPSTEVSPGDEMVLVLEDPSGINLTKAFPVFSILVKVFDPDGRELLRLDLTDRFQYDEGSHTRGRATFNVPDLVPGSYDFVVTAADNNGFTSRLSTSFLVGSAGGGASLRDVLAYPNPFDPERESTRVMFTLNRSARVTARIYSVAGRLVWKDEKTVAAGTAAFLWDGRDRGGDRVANGVYLVQLNAHPAGGGAADKHLERVVVLR